MRHKSVKDNIRHLNDCYKIFETESNKKGISEENKIQYIQLLLKSYVNSQEILDTNINEIKEIDEQ